MRTPFDRKLLWVHWKGDAVTENSIEALTDHIKQVTPNVAGVLLKTSNGADWQGANDNKAALAISGQPSIVRWVNELGKRGLETHLWCVVRGNDISREAELVIQACQVPGVGSMLLDVEGGAEYFGGKQDEDARNLITRIRAGIHPDFHLGLNFDARGSHPANIHIQEWIPHVQSLHPMVYHWEFGGGEQGPEVYLDDAFGTLARYGLPVVPMLQTYPQPTAVPGAQIVQASEYAFAKGAVGLTYFRYGGESSAEWITTAIQGIDPDRDAPDSAPEKRTFQVQATRLRIRSAPGTGSQTSGFVESGAVVGVDAKSRTEADGYVWWQSEQGWLAQSRVDNLQTLMVEHTPGAPPYGVPLLEARIDEPTRPDSTNNPDVPDKRFRVATSVLNVRSQPELGREFLLNTQLQRGDEIVVDADAWTEKNGFVWWFHGTGWSAEVSLGSGLRFMDDLTPEVKRIEASPVEDKQPAPPPVQPTPAPTPQPEPQPSEPEPAPAPPDSSQPEPAPAPEPAPTPPTPDVPLKRFRVISRTLNIRTEPGLAHRGFNGVLNQGDEVQIRADRWLEKDGYVWWQHSTGWSAECSLDGSQRFMTDLTPEIPRVEPAPEPTEPAPEPAPTPTTPTPGSDIPQRFRVVALGLTIRDAPNTDAVRLGRLQQGDELILDVSKQVEADGYVWHQHERGWSAERSLDGKEELMLNVDTLPMLGNLLKRHPVRLEETDWIQFFGNTSFAFRFGRRNSYDKFSQGLHSGIDYGKFMSNPGNPSIFAAVEGLFDGRGLKYGPNRVDVLVGPYRIIYGHMGRPANLPRRTPVTPDAVMGIVENTQIHLHFEIRYRDKYILNPFLFMPQTMVEEFLAKFPQQPNSFIETGSWKRWVSPLDQPIIRLGGEVIGPTA